MKKHYCSGFWVSSAVMVISFAVFAAADVRAGADVSIIGTGGVGDSVGPSFAVLGYLVVYGSRNPDSEKAQNLVA